MNIIIETGRHTNAKPIEYYIDADGCWMCTSHAPYQSGYCFVFRGGKRVKLHRYVYELLVKKIEDDMLLCHRCDKRACINPECMFEGTSLDNMLDKISKGRHNSPVGSRHGQSKLEEEDIHEIRYLHSIGYSQKFLADGYGVRHTAISRIISRKRWGHI